MFDQVTYGNPWYYWFKRRDEIRVFRVIRDHTGGLWVSQHGYSTKMSTWLLGNKCLGPVKPPEEYSAPLVASTSSVPPDKKTMELEIIFPE